MHGVVGKVVWCGVLCCGGRGHPELIEDAGVRSGKVVEMNGWLAWLLIARARRDRRESVGKGIAASTWLGTDLTDGLR